MGRLSMGHLALRVLWALPLLAPLMAAAVKLPAGVRVDVPGTVPLAGYWFAAEAPGPRPTVVALHGCSGPHDKRGQLTAHLRRYAADLNAAQMHVLVLDSFGPRGLRSICEIPQSRRTVREADRRADVQAALRWLAARPEVDATRLVLLGWSHGAQTVLAALDASNVTVQAETVQPRAAVAFYPGCTEVLKNINYRLQAPLLMMVGERDDWTASAPCVRLHQRLGAQAPRFEIEVYADSYHGFDSLSPVKVRDNVGNTRSGKATVGGNPAAQVASRERMLRYLAEQLQ